MATRNALPEYALEPTALPQLLSKFGALNSKPAVVSESLQSKTVIWKGRHFAPLTGTIILGYQYKTHLAESWPSTTLVLESAALC